MIRQLCFAAVAVLFAVSSCSASFVIDDFSTYTNGATGGTANPSGATLSTLAMSASAINPSFISFNGVTGSFFGVGRSVGDMISLNYNFGQTIGSLTNLTVDGVNIPFIDNANWDLEIFGDGNSLALIAPSPNDPIIATGDLSNFTNLEFKYTVNALPAIGGPATFNFGAPQSSLTAVPEPTSLLMFPAAIGLVLARRRRKN